MVTLKVAYKALRKAVKAVEKEDAALPAVKGSRKMGVERKNKEASTTTKKVTLEDFEIRYKNIRKNNPKVKKCTVKNCHNPRDSTPLLGEDTCCAYHRLLFDLWSIDIAHIRGHNILRMSQKGRRTAFTFWMNRTGKETLDKLVLRMAQEGINWEC